MYGAGGVIRKYIVFIVLSERIGPSAAKISHNGREIILNRTKITLL